MFAWIADNAVTIIAVIGVLLAVGLAVFSLVRSKKSHPNGCTGNCATCGMGCAYGKEKP